MPNKFEIGDHVLVVPDEGLDTPREARGKTGRITRFIKDDAGTVVEYWVTVPGVQSFNATPYHIIPVPQVKRLDDPKVMTEELLNLDPDLREHVIDAQVAIPELQGFSLTTVLFTMAWLGYDELQRNSRILRGSAISEIVK
jgi:hypothetical protein